MDPELVAALAMTALAIGILTVRDAWRSRRGSRRDTR